MLDIDTIESGYGSTQILHGVSLDVEMDEIVTIIGPNGAGKSTLLKAIVGLVPCWSGTMTFQDRDITDITLEKVVYEGICFVPQTDNIFPNLTVRENLKMGAWSLIDNIGERIDELYELFPTLREREGQLAGNMSGGQQQMIALASALMVDPDLLILDEPSGGLAPDLVDKVFAKIREINAANTTVLMVEQNARQALRVSDRGVVLAMGEKRLEGDSQDLLDSPEIADLYIGNA
jgi:ABC-type branched-subunit amino acid transport system ATPase component